MVKADGTILKQAGTVTIEVVKVAVGTYCIQTSPVELENYPAILLTPIGYGVGSAALNPGFDSDCTGSNGGIVVYTRDLNQTGSPKFDQGFTLALL
jgi:hypothetical protein